MAPEGECARSSVAVQVQSADDSVAAVRFIAAVERFLSVIVLAVEWEVETRAAVSSARSALELGLAAGEAVSDGNVAAAASAAICILPPLVATKRRLQALHANLRLLRDLAGSTGLELPRPEAPEPPAARYTRAGTGAPAVMQTPLHGRILELYSFPDGGFAAQTPRGVASLPDGQSLLGPAAGQRGGLGHLKCAVTFRRRVACLRVEEQHDQQGNYLGAHLAVLDSYAGSQIVASVSRNGTLSDLGLTFDATGTLLFAYLYRQTVGDQTIVETRLVRGPHTILLPFQPSLGALEQLGGSGRRDDPIQFVKYRDQWHLFYRDGRALLISRLDRPDSKIEVAARVSLDVRPVVGGDGLLYVFYHEPGSRSARVAISGDGVRFFDRALDSRESGWQLEAIPTKDGALAAYYYYRNSYNKGIRVAALSRGALVRRPSTLMREDRWNAGWHPHMACDRGGEVLLTYLSNVEADTRVWSRFNEPKNLLDYAMVDTGTWEDHYKNWFLQAGAGVWYTWWKPGNTAPKATEVDGAVLHPARYHVEPSLLFSASVEARIGPIDLGASYAQNFLDEQAEGLDGSTGVLTGQIRIEDLLPGHDVKVEALWGRYQGRARRKVEGEDLVVAPFDTNYVDVRLYGLNQWRVKYGLAFTRYELPTAVVAYSAGDNQTRYTYAASELRNAGYYNVLFTAGYSKLDYLAKYENNYFGPIADVSGDVGASILSFGAIPTPEGNVTSAVGLHLRGQLDLGWLWMARARSLAGLGLYLRPRYTLEAATSGSSDRPEDRKSEDATSATTSATFALTWFRHGPWLDAGVVW